MAEVKPFKAWRYNPEQTPRMENVVVPPYDVITESELTQMDSLSPYNFSKIILSRGEGKHLKAAARLGEWQKEKILVQDASPGFYLYKQEFKLTEYELFCQKTKKTDFVRYGFFARVAVEDYSRNIILPHEKTFAKYKADRYELMEATQGNMEPVFLGYDSEFLTGMEFQEAARRSALLYDYKDLYGVEHKLWFTRDPESCAKIEKALAAERLYILDGHHRYETALKFHQDHGGERTKYVLANVCAFNQPGTIILPTHRLMSGLSLDLLEQHFSKEKVSSLSELEEKLVSSSQIAFGLKMGAKPELHLITLKDSLGTMLDLDYLHNKLLPTAGDVKIHYVRSIPEFLDELGKDKFELGFLVRPNTYEDVVQKAARQEVMPHKSTFFYPKIPSGLIIHCFE